MQYAKFRICWYNLLAMLQANLTGAVPETIATRLGTVEYARSGEGPALLVLHGARGGWDQGMMLARSAVGVPDFDVIAMSRPGYLGTPLERGRTPRQQADLCAALLDSLGVAEAAVAAASGGGPCALQFALHYPTRCRALVMIASCSASITRRVPWWFHLLLRIALLRTVAARMRRKMEQHPEAAARRFIPDATLRAQTLSDPEAGPILREFQVSLMDHFAERLPGIKNDITQVCLPFAYPVDKIQVPALVVHGTADEVIPFAQAEGLAARLPAAELVAIPGGRHVILFTHLHLIRPQVRQFLARQFHINRP